MGQRTCSVEGCGQSHLARGWCSKHYQRWRQRGEPGPAGPLLARKIATACEQCQAPFTAIPAEIARGGGRFCSSICARAARYGVDEGERFWRKVARGSSDECWLWTAARAGAGYGAFYIRRLGDTRHRLHYAHRYSWTLVNGPVPEGLVVMHTCDTPLCVNPAHLIAATQTENMRDMVAKGRHGKQRPA